jgi:ubiquinone/menaquinone biosynthesis C-methylase UbiE
MDQPDDFDRVRASYDAVAAGYDERFGSELRRKPLDRALLSALVELAGSGVIADVGCGSGQITRFLAGQYDDVVGVDLSPAMVERGRVNAPTARFEVASMTDLPTTEGEWAAVVAFYSVVNLVTEQRRAAYGEFARVVRPGGWLLLAFHIDGADAQMGGELHLTTWFDRDVDLTFYYLDPDEQAAAVTAAGFAVKSTTIRVPDEDVEAVTRRCYLLAQRT